MSVNMFQWIVDISSEYRIFLVGIIFIFFIRAKEWWSLPIFILLSLTLLTLILNVIFEGNFIEILIVIPLGFLSIVLAIRMFLKRLKTGESLYKGKGFNLRFP